MDENPYQSPQVFSSEITAETRAEAIATMVKLPAMFLIILAIPSLLFDVFLDYVAVVDSYRLVRAGSVDEALFGSWPFVLTLVHVVGLKWSFNMFQLKAYQRSMTAAIVAIFPVCSPACIIGIPFGIWAMVVLSRSDVKSAFHERSA